MSSVPRPAPVRSAGPMASAAPIGSGSAGSTPGAQDGYLPGVCNIGSWEVRRRRAFAIVGLVVAAVLLAGLVAGDAPSGARLVLLVPLWGGIFSWLQARRRFCAAFAIARVANFGDTDASRHAIDDPAGHRADLAAVVRMTRDSFLIAAALTLIAVLLPV